jgi:hypothetical protein
MCQLWHLHDAHEVAKSLADEVGKQRRTVRFCVQPRQLFPHQALQQSGKRRWPVWRVLHASARRGSLWQCPVC